MKTSKMRLRIATTVLVLGLFPMHTQAGFLDYFNFDNWWGGDEKKTTTPSTDDSSDSTVVINPAATEDPITYTGPNHVGDGVACQREELDPSFFGLDNLMSYFGQACTLNGVRSALEMAGDRNEAVKACKGILSARANCPNMPNPLDQPGMEQVLSSMERSDALREAEIEAKEEILERDLEGLKNLSLIQHTMASNYEVLGILSKKMLDLYAQKDASGARPVFEEALEKYGLKDDFDKAMAEGGDVTEVFSLASIASNAFQCTPAKMESRDHEVSLFDEESGCGNEPQASLMNEAKRRLFEKANNCSGSNCPFENSFMMGQFGSGEGLYSAFMESNIKTVLSDSSNPLFGIGDLGQSFGYGDNKIVADTLFVMNGNGDLEVESPRKTFENLIGSFDANTSYEQQVISLRQKGVEEAAQRYIASRLSHNPRHQKIMNRIAQEVAQVEASGERFENYEMFINEMNLRRIATEVAPGQEPLDEQDLRELRNFSVVLRTGANYAEDYLQRATTFQKVQGLFGITDPNQVNAFSMMKSKIDDLSKLDPELLRSGFLANLESLKATSPLLKLLLDSNKQGSSDPLAALKGIISEFERVEKEGAGFGQTMTLAEVALAERSIADCQERRKKRRRDALFCSPLNDQEVAGKALKDLLEKEPTNEADGRNRLAQATLLCAPILQGDFIASFSEDSSAEAIINGANNHCRELAQSLLGLEESEVDNNTDAMIFTFNSTCESAPTESNSATPTAVAGADDTASCNDSNFIAQQYSGAGSTMSFEASTGCKVDLSGAEDSVGSDGELTSNAKNSIPTANGNDLFGFSSPFSRKAMKSSGMDDENNGSNYAKGQFYRDPLAEEAFAMTPLSGGSSAKSVNEDATNSDAGFTPMNAKDYVTGNAAMAANSAARGVARGKPAAQIEQEVADFENNGGVMDAESSALLDRLKAKERELDEKLKFYDDVLASERSSGATGPSEASSALSAEIARLQGETDSLRQKLSDRLNTAVASTASPTPARITSPIAAPAIASRGIASVAPAEVVQAAPAAPATVASIGRNGSFNGGSFEGGGSSLGQASAIANGRVTAGDSEFSLTSASVLTLTSDLRKKIVGEGVSLIEAARAAQGSFLMPTETEGVYTLFEPLIDEDGEVVTLDGEIQFKQIVRVTEDGKPIKASPSRAIASEIEEEEEVLSSRRPTRVDDFNIIRETVDQVQ